MLGAPVFIPRAARNCRLVAVTVRRQQRACGRPGRATELRLNGLAQVLQNMKSIGDLPGLRRAFPRALGERAAAIAADDLDLRMPLEPVRRRARGTIRQKVDYLPPLQVDDDGPISGALAPRPIIDAHDPNIHCGAARLRLSFETAQDSVVAGRHADALHQPFTRAAADAMAEKINEFGRPSGAARSRGRNLGQLLDEGFTLARSVSTLPTLETKLHLHSRTLRRQIL